jgi:lipopolysaccharide export system protein LptC
MFSDEVTDNKLLDTTTQAELAAAKFASTSPDSARLTVIGTAQLKILRKNNRILRSNNISIMKQKNEMEALALAAERKVKQLEKELKAAREEHWN